jgi:protein-tyrosine phosphatase
MDFTDRGGDVADPWYSRNFDAAYRDIRDGCEGILHWIEETERVRPSKDGFGS